MGAKESILTVAILCKSVYSKKRHIFPDIEKLKIVPIADKDVVFRSCHVILQRRNKGIMDLESIINNMKLHTENLENIIKNREGQTESCKQIIEGLNCQVKENKSND